MKKLLLGTVILILALTAIMAGCAPSAQTGTLQFNANGEDFVRQGFVSKDGWAITFDHVYVTLADITAYQASPPYEPAEGGELQAEAQVNLPGTHTLDLAEGGEDAPPIFVGEVKDAAAGHYNALAWKMVQAAEGRTSGYSLVIIGTAEKDGQTVNFTIKVEQEYEYTCGEFVGDERKGILEDGGTADLEMTFHFDHVFGDAETPPDDDLNVMALGFEPFAAVAEAGTLDADLAGLEAMFSSDDYQKMEDILLTLGHVGEGHCHCR